MKRVKYILPLVMVIAFSSCSNAQSTEEKTTTSETTQVINKDVDVKEFVQLVESGNGIIVDVRTDGEFTEGHIKGAKQINISDANFNEELKKLDPATPIYVYCKSGGRSGRAAKAMKEMGFQEVYNLEGGITSWQRAQQPIEK